MNNKDFHKREFLKHLLIFANTSFHQEMLEATKDKDISEDEHREFLNGFKKAIFDFGEKFHSDEVEVETLPQVTKLLNEFNRDYLKIIRAVDKIQPSQKDDTIDFLNALFKELGFDRVEIVSVENK